MKIKKPGFKKVKTDPKQFVTNCLICNNTCHKRCTINPADSKEGCASMSEGYCTVFKNKCHYSQHTNADFFFVDTVEQEEVTIAELYNEYKTAETGKMTNAKLFEQIELERRVIQLECLKTNQRVAQCIQYLNDKALQNGKEDHYIDYFLQLIEAEELEKKENFRERIKNIRDQLEKYNLLVETSKKNHIEISDEIERATKEIERQNPSMWQKVKSLFR